MQMCLVGLMLAERQVVLGRPSGRLVPYQLFPLSLLGTNIVLSRFLIISECHWCSIL